MVHAGRCVADMIQAALMLRYTKRVVGYKTKLKKEGAKKALEEGKKLAEEANAGGKQFAVKLFDFVIDGKAGKKMVTEMAKIAPGCAFAMLSCDPAKGKTNCYLSVGKDALAKVKAGDWAKAIIA